MQLLRRTQRSLNLGLLLWKIEDPKKRFMYLSSTHINNLLNPHECSRCRSSPVVQNIETSAYRYGFFVLFSRHQTVRFNAPVCANCAALCDRRRKLVFLLMKIFLGLLCVLIIWAFITKAMFDAVWFSTLAGIGSVFVFGILGHFAIPRLARFDGRSIHPLKRASK
jgi:hypothetical protein